MYDAVQHRLGDDRTETTGQTRRWFEYDPTPIVLIAFDRRVLEVNTAGRRAISEVATFADGRLEFSDPSARRAFEAAFDTIASCAADRVSTILRCDDGFWRRVTIMRCADPETEAAFVIVHGADRGDRNIGALAEAFGLTPAECRVLQILSGGASAKTIAAQLGVSPHTIRAHLRSLYGKIKVRGACDLVREYTRLTS